METTRNLPPRPRMLSMLGAALMSGFVTTAPAAVLWEQLPTRSATAQDTNYNHRSSTQHRNLEDYHYRWSSYSWGSGSRSGSYRYTRDYADAQVYLDDFTPQKRWQLTEGETWGWSDDDYALNTVDSSTNHRTEYLPWNGAVGWAIYASPDDAGLDPMPLYAGLDANATRAADETVNICALGQDCGNTGYHYNFSFGDDVFLDAGLTYWIQIAAFDERSTERFGTQRYRYSSRYYSSSSTRNYDVGTNEQLYREFHQSLSSNTGNATRVYSRPEYTQSYDYDDGNTDTSYDYDAYERAYANQGELAFRLLGNAIGTSSPSTVTASEPGTALVLGVSLAVLLRRQRRSGDRAQT
ncbi:MAG: hypothetical protein AAF458_02330 [Pseudomonadota bacterium]